MWGQRLSEEEVRLKPHLTHDQQLKLLADRGLELPGNLDAAKRLLSRVGYYRLSGYFYPLRKTKARGETGRLDDFVEGASLELILALSEFDKALRVIVMHAVETIEVALRVAIAHELGKLHSEAHLNPRYLSAAFTKTTHRGTSAHEDWIKRFHDLCSRSKEDFVKHHDEKYAGHMPIWVAIELWDFGLLSKFFGGLQVRDQRRISQRYSLVEDKILANWLWNFAFLRNVVAHHARLWNRTNPAPIKLPAPERVPLLKGLDTGDGATGKLFSSLTCMRYLIRTIDPTSQWHLQLRQVLKMFPSSPLLSLASAGFPEDWESWEVWAAEP